MGGWQIETAVQDVLELLGTISMGLCSTDLQSPHLADGLRAQDSVRFVVGPHTALVSQHSGDGSGDTASGITPGTTLGGYHSAQHTTGADLSS